MIAFADAASSAWRFTPGRRPRSPCCAAISRPTPDPDRGSALAAVTGELTFTAAKPALIRDLAAARTDPALFALVVRLCRRSGRNRRADLAGAPAKRAPPPSLAEVVRTLQTRAASRPARRSSRAGSTPRMPIGAVRAVEAHHRRPARRRLGAAGQDGAGRIAARAHRRRRYRGSLARPRAALSRRCSPGSKAAAARARPGRRAGVPPADAGPSAGRPTISRRSIPPRCAPNGNGTASACSWWPTRAAAARIYSRGADDISGAFPEILDGDDFPRRARRRTAGPARRRVAPFADLQQRLNRKTRRPRKMLRDFPVAVRLYDILFDGAEDLRRAAVRCAARAAGGLVRRSTGRRAWTFRALIRFATLDELAALRDGARAAGDRRPDAQARRLRPMSPGGRRGLWWKWKRDPLTLDAVLMYAQRGHGKRSSFYSDYTFGALARRTA